MPEHRPTLASLTIHVDPALLADIDSLASNDPDRRDRLVVGALKIAFRDRFPARTLTVDEIDAIMDARYGAA